MHEVLDKNSSTKELKLWLTATVMPTPTAVLSSITFHFATGIKRMMLKGHGKINITIMFILRA